MASSEHARSVGADVADDATLVARLIAGDVDALRAIMAVHWDRLVAAACITTGSPDLAREAVQDAFVQLWNARGTLDPSQGIRGYLMNATRWRARDLMRHEQMHARIAQEMAAQQAAAIRAARNAGEHAIESAELRARIRAVVSALPPRCREILLLSRQAQLSYSEIEVMLGISNATIRNQMSRALQAIAQAIADWRAGK